MDGTVVAMVLVPEPPAERVIAVNPMAWAPHLMCILRSRT